MKNYKQFFQVVLTSIFVILAFVGCESTSDVDGVYEKYVENEFTGEYIYVEDVEFKSGKFKGTNAMSSTEGTFKIIAEDVIEWQNSGKDTKYKTRLIRDENNKVIKMDDEETFLSNRIHVRKNE